MELWSRTNFLWCHPNPTSQKAPTSEKLWVIPSDLKMHTKQHASNVTSHRRPDKYCGDGEDIPVARVQFQPSSLSESTWENDAQTLGPWSKRNIHSRYSRCLKGTGSSSKARALCFWIFYKLSFCHLPCLNSIISLKRASLQRGGDNLTLFFLPYYSVVFLHTQLTISSSPLSCKPVFLF
jgi:hypothetical protein